MYKFKTYQSSNENLVTSCHPFYCLKNKDNNYNDLIDKLKNNIIKPEYIELENISNDDYIGFPIMKYNEDIIELTFEDCIFYGMLLVCHVELSNDILELHHLENVEIENYLLLLNINYKMEHNYGHYIF
jgi:hypothetical protein